MAVDAHLVTIGADKARAAGYTGKGQTIGFVDTGVRRDHPALSGRVLQNFIHVDSPANNTSVDAVNPHGTVMAELAAGSALGSWPGGVAPDAKIVSSRVFPDNAGGQITLTQSPGATIKAINGELINAGARIINNSWSVSHWDDPMITRDLVAAYDATGGALYVFANGNDGGSQPSDIAMLPLSPGWSYPVFNWLTVGAVDTSDPTKLASYSSQCGPAKRYCLVAPGDAAYPGVTNPQTIGYDSGTSISSALVSGAAADVAQKFPYFGPELLSMTLRTTAKDLGEPGVDPVFGWGLLDLQAALRGPAQLDHGVAVVITPGKGENGGNSSTWWNPISGTGELLNYGDGRLILAGGRLDYSGPTHVLHGDIELLNSRLTTSSVEVDNFGGLTLRADSTAATGSPTNVGVGGNVLLDIAQLLKGESLPKVGNTSGFQMFYDPGRSDITVYTIGGNFTIYTPDTRFVMDIGTRLDVAGTASLRGTVVVNGANPKYVFGSKEVFLTAGKISGTFKSLQTAPNVFLDATLGYDATSAFLNINRLNVTAAATGMGLTPAAVAGATRVERAMSTIDGQFANGGNAIPANFIMGATAIQQTPDSRVAEQTLSSLSGQLQGASATMTLESLDAGRRALGERFANLSDDAMLKGTWSQDLQRNGTMAQSGLNSLGLNVSGQMSGYDQRISRDAVAGVAVSQTQMGGWVNGLGDRAQGHQSEAQVYGGMWRGNWFAFGSTGAGRYERRTDRTLRLGFEGDTASALQHGSYAFAGLEGGYRFNAGNLHLLPYVGTQYASIRNEGFREFDASGFGLQANAWRNDRWQGYAGLRLNRDWRLANGWRFGLEARGEFQQLLQGNDTLQASFTGVDQWMPVSGLGLARQGRLFGLGFNLDPSARTHFRFDLSQRSSSLGSDRSWMARYERAF